MYYQFIDKTWPADPDMTDRVTSYHEDYFYFLNEALLCPATMVQIN